jgi:hypothetical protein
VIEENKRKHADPRDEARRKAREYKAKQQQLAKDAEAVGFFVVVVVVCVVVLFFF